MAISFGEFIASPLFTFQVGDEKRDFIVHSEPFARLSQSLENLITGDMIEAESRRVVWQDVDEDTFFRLCEYAYIQDYTPPRCEHLSLRSSTPPAEQVDSDDHTPPPQTPRDERAIMIKNKKKKKKCRPSSWDPPAPPEADQEPEEEPEEEPKEEPQLANDDWGEWGYSPLPRQQKIISEPKLLESFSCLNLSTNSQKTTYQFIPQENTSAMQDFTPVFLGHAQLWVLADKYQIDALCSLVLHKLYQTLDGFTLYTTSTTSIIEFLRFVYSNTRSPESGINDLRNLAVCYAASAVGRIGDTEEFKQLLAEGGDFVMDFWNVVWVNNK